MNIAIFPSDYYPSVGGVQEVARQTAQALARAGDKALVITNRWPKTMPAAETLDGVAVRRHVFRVPGETTKQLVGTILTKPLTLSAICRQLKELSANLIHVHCVSSNSYYAVRAARKLKLPTVLTIHGELSMDATDLFKRSKFARQNLRDAINQADAITACSQNALDEAEAFYGQSFGHRGRVVYSGVRVKDFENATPHSHSRPYILAIGRLAPQKGFDVLIEAFADIAKVNHSFDIILAGDGPDEQLLKDLAKKLGLADRVMFFGPANRQQVVQLFSGADLVVTPSRKEAMGIVNLEAMSCAKAVISTRVGGVPEIVIDGDTGILVTPGSVAELRQAMHDLLSKPDRRNRLGQAGLVRAVQFDWSRINEQFRTIYAELLSSSSSVAAHDVSLAVN